MTTMLHPSPPAEIRFADGVSAPDRAHIERAVATLVERSASAAARDDAVRVELAEARAAADAPLIRLLDADDHARQAHRAARASWRTGKVAAVGPATAPPALPILDIGKVIRFGDTPSQIFQPPFHFDWQWSDSDGSHHLASTAQKSIGAAVIDTAVGVDGTGDATRLRAHAGVGVSLTTDRDVVVMGRALRWTHHKYSVGGAIYYGDATAEGGAELTVLENGNLLTAATEKVWRARRSNGEIAQFWDHEEFAVGAPLEVVWTMRPGRHYTFNVGAWVYVERHDGWFGADSWARGFISAKFGALTLFR